MEYLLKASAVIVLFYLCFSLLLKKETFFQHNRWFLLIGLIIALIFPTIVIPIYIPIEPIVFQKTTFIQNTTSDFVAALPEPSFNWLSLLPIIYGIGFAVFSIQFILQFGSLVLLLLKNPSYKDKKFTYVIIENKISPFSFFYWIVYNPEPYKEEELQLILTHEKVHVNQIHSLDILFTQLACIVFWFNPLIWLYRKEVRQNLEYIADSITQSTTKTRKEYQHLLLKTSVPNHDISLSNNFYNSSIKKRIVMLNKSRSNRKKQWKYALMLPLLAGLLMSMNTEKIYVEKEYKINTKNYSSFERTDKKNIEIIFTKNTTDKQLEVIKKELKTRGISMTTKRLKRNDQNEIIDFNLEFKTENGSANYNVQDANGINDFYFNMKDDGSFGVGAINNDVHEIETIYESQPKKSHSKSKSNIFIYEIKSDSLEVIVEDSINGKYLNKHYEKIKQKLRNHNEQNSKDSIFIGIDSSEVIRLSKVKTDYLLEEGNHEKINNKSELLIIREPSLKRTYYTSENDKPLILVDGREVSNDAMKILKPKDIDSMNILKGDSATEIYGEKGKNGVILITTKGNNTWIEKSEVKEKSPWSISYSTSYTDEDDASKNGTLVYISKVSADHILEAQKTILEKRGIEVKYSKLRRNKAGEITSIKIRLKNEKGNESSASYKNDDGISKIEFGISEGTLVIRTSTMPID